MILASVLALALPPAAAEPFEPDRPGTWQGTWITIRGERLVLAGGTFWEIAWEGVGPTEGVRFENVRKRRREVQASATGSLETPVRISALDDGTGLWLDSNLSEGLVSQRLYPAEGVEGLSTRPEPDIWGTWFGPFWDAPHSVAFAQVPRAGGWRFNEAGPRGACTGELTLSPEGSASAERRCPDGRDAPSLEVVDADTLRWEGRAFHRSRETGYHPGRVARAEGSARGEAGERVQVDGRLGVVVPEGFRGRAAADRLLLEGSEVRVEVLVGPFVDEEGFRVAWQNLAGTHAAPERLPGPLGILAYGDAKRRLFAVPVDPERAVFLVFTASGTMPPDADALATAIAPTLQVGTRAESGDGG